MKIHGEKGAHYPVHISSPSDGELLVIQSKPEPRIKIVYRGIVLADIQPGCQPTALDGYLPDWACEVARVLESASTTNTEEGQ